MCGSICYDLQSDPEHCGSCDSTCPNNVACVNGSCQGCQENTIDCDGDPSNGCEKTTAIVRMGTRAAAITALRGLWASVLVRPVSKRVRETIGGIA